MKPNDNSLASMTFASIQGGRSHQEDRAVMEWIESAVGSGWLLGVFDGHRGAASAETAAGALRWLFVERWVAQRGNAEAALKNVFASFHELTANHQSGSTATVVFIPQDATTAVLAVLGDSPVAILSATGEMHIGPDHNVRTNAREREAAQTRGGVYRGGYLEDGEHPGVGLQMSRALGDADLARVLERAPEIRTVPLGGQGIVLIGSDGLLSPSEESVSEQLAKLLAFIRQGADAEAVVKNALWRGSEDNITAVVWRSKKAS